MYLRTRMLGVVTVCVLVGCSVIEKDPRITMGPYVNRVDESSARILWVSQADATSAGLCLEDDGERLKLVSVPLKIGPGEEVLHTVSVAGLKDSTRYRYRIGSGPAEAHGSFLTAPAKSMPFRFVAYGDMRSQPERHRVVSEGIAKESPAFVVCVGDLVGNGQVWEQWSNEFFSPAQCYLQQSTLWPVRGNHEGDAVLYRQLFDLPGNELYYSFEFSNAHFVVLDSQIGAEKQTMLQWLQQDLAENDAE